MSSVSAADGPRLLQRVSASDPQKLIKVIEADGCAIITNFTTPELLSQVNAETAPYLLADKPWRGALFPPETRRCARLISRSKTARENWLCSNVVTQLIEYFLSTTTSNYYGEEKHTYTSHPIINISVTLEINPGAQAQRLHRDDKNHHVRHEDMSKSGYRLGADMGMAFLVPGVETTRENGATWAIPGSHLWDGTRVPTPDEVTYACMKPGEAYCMLGGTYHAGGANTTAEQKRPMHGIFFCRGTLRTEENQYLIHTPEEVLSWSSEVQQRMGFNISSPNIGFVDFRNPIQFFSGVSEDEDLADADPEPQFEMVKAEDVNRVYKEPAIEKPFSVAALPIIVAINV